jgi:hypothetical protein
VRFAEAAPYRTTSVVFCTALICPNFINYKRTAFCRSAVRDSQFTGFKYAFSEKLPEGNSLKVAKTTAQRPLDSEGDKLLQL